MRRASVFRWGTATAIVLLTAAALVWRGRPTRALSPAPRSQLAAYLVVRPAPRGEPRIRIVSAGLAHPFISRIHCEPGYFGIATWVGVGVEGSAFVSRTFTITESTLEVVSEDGKRSSAGKPFLGSRRPARREMELDAMERIDTTRSLRQRPVSATWTLAFTERRQGQSWPVRLTLSASLDSDVVTAVQWYDKDRKKREWSTLAAKLHGKDIRWNEDGTVKSEQHYWRGRSVIR